MSWIKGLSLTLLDEQVLLNEPLNANLVNAGQRLLKKSHVSQNGLQDTSLLYELHRWRSLPLSFVQLLFTSNNHWVCISNKFSGTGEVYLYDSAQSALTPDGDIASQACAILRSSGKAITIKTVNTQQQQGVSDCGLFALAFACDLCQGRDPCTRIYYQSKLRSHYRSCLLCEAISVFPSRGTCKPMSVIDEAMVDIFCVCRLPEKLPMACCDVCNEWFHNSCVTIPSEVFAADVDIKWICNECQSELEVFGSCSAMDFQTAPPLIS